MNLEDTIRLAIKTVTEPRLRELLEQALKEHKEDCVHNMDLSYEVGREHGQKTEREACVRFVRSWAEWSDELADALADWRGK